MDIRYIDGDEVRFTKNGDGTVNALFYTGEVAEELEPRKLFPVSGGTRYVALIGGDGVQKAIIRNISALTPESSKVIEDCLNEYYVIPRITAILKTSEKNGIITWTAETDRGMRTFEIKNRAINIRVLFDGRILVRDTNDNRYEIPDINALDRKSKERLNREI